MAKRKTATKIKPKRKTALKREAKPANKMYRNLALLALGVIIVLAIAAYAAIYLISPVNEEEFVKITLIQVSNDSLIIGNNCTALIASTSPERLDSIALGLANTIDIRPTTHDNFAAVLNAFNITLDRVEIYRFDNDIFYSDAYFRSQDNILQLDMRPSDAIALAVRTKSPVYINRTILAAMGEDIC